MKTDVINESFPTKYYVQSNNNFQDIMQFSESFLFNENVFYLLNSRRMIKMKLLSHNCEALISLTRCWWWWLFNRLVMDIDDSESTIIIGPCKSVLVYALHSLEYVLGLARFRVFVPKLLLLLLWQFGTPELFSCQLIAILNTFRTNSSSNI